MNGALADGTRLRPPRAAHTPCAVTSSPDGSADGPATRMDPVLSLFGEGDRFFVRTILECLARDRTNALARTRDLYVQHVGSGRTLSDFEFDLLFGGTVDAFIAVRDEGGTQPFLDHCRAVGDQLALRRVPFAEFLVALYFFEDACLACEGVPPDTRAHRAFDRLSHQLIGAVASAFVARTAGEAAALRQSLERDARRLAPGSRSVFHGLVGKSSPMRRLFARLAAAAPRKTTVLLVGETGTGKELCARAIHDLSDRRRGPFVPVNCAAIPREILASELFGHRRGAFTGAVADARGLIAAAEKGTLFLDEVTEMDGAAQVALLRVLEQHAIRPVGATGERPVDVRFVAATNRVPDEAVADGKLRLDLYHRLAATTIEVPPLRDRAEDLPILIDHLFARWAAAESLPTPVLAPEAQEALRVYSWPGNVRELANALESAATFSRGPLIARADLPERILRTPGVAPAAGAAGAGSAPVAPPVAAAPPEAAPLRTIHQSELELVHRALDEHGGNKAAAARALGISRKRLYAKLREIEASEPGSAGPSSDGERGTAG